MSMSDTPPVSDYLSQISGGDEEFEKETFEIFLADTSGRIDRLKEALGSGDLKLAGRELHSLKGATTSVGAAPLHEYVVEVEGKFAELGADERADAVVRIRSMFEEIRVYVTKKYGL